MLQLVLAVTHLVSSALVLGITLGYGVDRRPGVYISSRGDTLTEIQVGTVPNVWLLSAAGFVSSLHHFVVRFRHLEGQDARTARWADYAVSSSLMIVVIASLSGVFDLFLLVIMGSTQAMLMVASGYFEVFRSRVATASMSFVYLLFVWMPIFTAFFQQAPPAFVYVIIFAIFAWFASFGVVYALVVEGIVELEGANKWYDLLSISAKVQLQWSLYGGINAGGELFVSVFTGIVIILSTVAAFFVRRISLQE
jgi:hypothetical protein